MIIYRMPPTESFEKMFLDMRHDLYHQTPVHVGEWQSQKTDMNMLEMLHVVMEMPMPSLPHEELGKMLGARLPWAEDHFQERVGGQPLNPAPSEAWWPFREKKDGDTNTSHKSEGAAFSHTYPERMWPKQANPDEGLADVGSGTHWGIRFEYGDLQDVVNQLVNHPMTRQAYLPIWFPEDTGAVHGKRVPCTLGYHFIIREGKLDISYFMRSTDLLRHFQDDIYLAIRLAQWVVDKINAAMHARWDEPQYNSYLNPDEDLQLGRLVFHTANLHIFEADKAIIDYWKTTGRSWI